MPRTLPSRSTLLLCAVLLSHAVAIDVESGGRPVPATARPQLARPAASARGSVTGVAGIQKQASLWVRRYVSFVNGAAKVSKWINMGCGAWLVFQTPVPMISSLITVNLPDFALCFYLGAFGLMLTGVEIPVGPLKRLFQVYFRFMYTTHGRLGFVILVAALTWSLKHVGVITKAFVVFNALLAFYVYYSPVTAAYQQEDAEVKESMKEAATELQKGASDALNLANMFGVGRMFRGSSSSSSGSGSSAPPVPADARPYATPSPYGAADQPAQPSSPYASAGRGSPSGYQSSWPSEEN